MLPLFVDVRYWYVAALTPETASPADAEIVTDVVFSQLEDPPVALTTGAVRSSITVLAGPAGDHADTFPAGSTAWNCTSVWPSSLTISELPESGPDQVTPPSVEPDTGNRRGRTGRRWSRWR